MRRLALKILLCLVFIPSLSVLAAAVDVVPMDQHGFAQEESVFARNDFFIVATDLEPDDMLFLANFARDLRSRPLSVDVIFVVGMGDALIKKARMEAYLAAWKLPSNIHTSVLVSSSSPSHPDDGLECLGREHLDALRKTSAEDRLSLLEQDMMALRHAIVQHDHGAIIQIKPFGTELDAYLTQKYLVDNYDFIMYEGWNVRNSIFDEQKNLNERKYADILRLLQGRKEPVTMVSNFKILEKNGFPRDISLGHQDLESLIGKMRHSREPFFKYLSSYIMIWNMKMLRNLPVRFRERLTELKVKSADRPAVQAFADNWIEIIAGLQSGTYSLACPGYEKLAEADQKLRSFLGEKTTLGLDDWYKGSRLNIYLGISACPDVQVVFADYHAYLALSHPEVYRWEEVAAEIEMDVSKQTYGLMGDAAPDSQAKIPVRWATGLRGQELGKEGAFRNFLAPLMAAVE